MAGEALIDLVPDRSAVDGRLASLRPLPGGGPYNVAITLGRLGVATRFVSRVSTDSFGEALLARLTESGVDTSMVQRGTQPTTLAVTSVEPDGSARYTFYAEGTADRLVADPGELPDEVGILSLGTLSLLLEPGATTYETMLRRHSRRGGLTVLDPNVRPTLVADPDAHRARFRSWLPDIGLLKLSVEDARWLADLAHDAKDGAVLDAVRGWVAAGPAAAVVTRGEHGLVTVDRRGEVVAVPAEPARVVDTIGAGDTVHGALLCWLWRTGAMDTESVEAVGEAGWRMALEYAARAAAVTISRRGAEPPFSSELTGPL